MHITRKLLTNKRKRKKVHKRERRPCDTPQEEHIWLRELPDKYMPCLSFSSKEFSTLPEFIKFVTHFLSLRDDKAQVFSVNLTFCEKGVSHEIMEQIVKYAISRNLKQLNITNLSDETFEPNLSLLCSTSLTHLTLDGCQYTGTAPPWDLPALETLNLYNFTFLSRHDNVTLLFPWSYVLMDLTLKNCHLLCPKLLIESRTPLSSLTLEEGGDTLEEGGDTPVSVLAPHLMNLTVRNRRNIYLDDTRRLSSLLYIDSRNDITNCDSNDGYYKGGFPLRLSSQLNKDMRMDICISCPIKKEEDIRKLISLLDQLVSVKVLTINWELVKVLSPFVKVQNPPSPPFFHLEQAIVYPATSQERGNIKVNPVFVSYLLKHSPLVFDDDLITVYEATIGMDDLKLVRTLTRQWQVALEGRMKEVKDSELNVSYWRDFFCLTSSWTQAKLSAKLNTVYEQNYRLRKELRGCLL